MALFHFDLGLVLCFMLLRGGADEKVPTNDEVKAVWEDSGSGKGRVCRVPCVFSPLSAQHSGIGLRAGHVTV